jgi:4-hydroxybenzoyl-CoA thioesterase
MVVVERPVRFQDVDPAGIVFFAHFGTYAHEAMETFFDRQVEGGYAGLVVGRRVGFPAVKLEVDYHAPLRYGDRVRIETTVSRLGNRSAVLRYRFRHGERDIAEVRHTVVITDLDRMKSRDMPDDVRAALTAHLERD